MNFTCIKKVIMITKLFIPWLKGSSGFIGCDAKEHDSMTIKTLF